MCRFFSFDSDFSLPVSALGLRRDTPLSRWSLGSGRLIARPAGQRCHLNAFDFGASLFKGVRRWL